MKVCLNCGQEKSLNSFFKDKSSKDGLKYKCKDCIKVYRNSYNSENKDKIQEYYLQNKSQICKFSAQYYEKHKIKHKHRGDLWKSQNKDKIRGYENKYRLKKKVWFKIKNSISCRIWGLLKGNSKPFRTETYLGCSIDYYKVYLESLFLPEMNWDNYGTIWEIDHIVPCINFNIEVEDEMLKCFHYSNTQPLFKTTKIAEGLGYSGQIGNRNKNKYIN